MSAGLMFVALMGCQKNPVAPPLAASKPVSVSIASWDEIQQIVAGQRGKVVVVDLWATW